MAKHASSNNSRSVKRDHLTYLPGFSSSANRNLRHVTIAIEDGHSSRPFEELTKLPLYRLKHAKKLGLGEYDPSTDTDHGFKALLCEHEKVEVISPEEIQTTFRLPINIDKRTGVWLCFSAKGWVPAIEKLTARITPVPRRRAIYWFSYEFSSLFPQGCDFARRKLTDDMYKNTWTIELELKKNNHEQTTSTLVLTATRRAGPRSK